MRRVFCRARLAVAIVGARADGHRPDRTSACIWSTRAAPSSTSSVPTTPSSTCRSSTVSRRRPRGARSSTTAGRALAGDASARGDCRSAPDLAERISQIDVSDVRDDAGHPEGRHDARARRRRAASPSGCSPTSTSRRRCASGCRTSTTSICGSTSASTCTAAGAMRDARVDVASPGPRSVVARGVRVARRERYIVGLDVGTSTVCCVVGESLDDGSLDIVGIGVAESRGIKRGVVVNLEAAVDSIKKAIEEAELMAGIEIDSVHLALSGPHVKGFNSRGVIAVAGKNREITRDDVRRAIDAAKAVALPTGREILHVLPQDFVVDEQDGIGAPVGHDRRAARGQRAHRHRRRVVDAEHRRLRQSRRRHRGRHGDRAAGRGRSGADAGREGARRRAGRHRRRHRRRRHLRARQPVAHRRRGGRRRSLHQRHRRRAAHADSRRGEGEAQDRLRAVVDGRTRTRRSRWPASAAASRG